MEKKTIRVLDTFAGAGGFSLGFYLAGAEIVGAIETDAWACETFQANHPDALVVKSDITKLKDEEISKLFGKLSVDVILGGPPCQGFSIANKKNGDPKDPRNSLFEEFIRLGKILKPRIMIMENVPNLIKAKTHDGELVIDIIKQELENLGYEVEHRIIEATNFGVPQIRKRLVVIASKVKLKNFFPDATHYVAGSNDLFEQKLLPVVVNKDGRSFMLPVLN